MVTVSIYKNIPLTRDGVNRLKGNSAELMGQLSSYLVDTYKVSYVKNGVVEISTVAYELDGCNYLTYYEGGGYVHFAFIDEVIWTSHHSCAISFTEDYFTTYASMVSLGRGKLIQTNSPNLDSNSYRLRLAGNYIPKHSTPLTVSNSLNIKVDDWGFIVGLVKPLNIFSEVIILQRRVSTLPTTGYWVYCSTALELGLLTAKFDFNPLASEEDILGIYAIPKFIGDELPTTVYTYGDDFILRLIDDATPPLEWNYNILSTTQRASKQWSDLWRSPYVYIDVQLLGDHYTFSPEDLCDDVSTLTNVTLKFGLTAKPCITIVLEGLRTNTTYKPITLGTINLPEIPYTTTQVSGWATGQGLISIAQSVASSDTWQEGVLKGIASHPMSVTAKNSGSIPTALQTTGDSRIWVRVIAPTTQEMFAIQDDLERYGFNYDINTPIDLEDIWDDVGSIGWNSATVPLYLKCEDVPINGNISHNALLTIRDALQNGVRIYTNINDLKNGEL